MLSDVDFVRWEAKDAGDDADDVAALLKDDVVDDNVLERIVEVKENEVAVDSKSATAAALKQPSVFDMVDGWNGIDDLMN
jgi:hypothetical protein